MTKRNHDTYEGRIEDAILPILKKKAKSLDIKKYGITKYHTMFRQYAHDRRFFLVIECPNANINLVDAAVKAIFPEARRTSERPLTGTTQRLKYSTMM